MGRDGEQATGPPIPSQQARGRRPFGVYGGFSHGTRATLMATRKPAELQGPPASLRRLVVWGAKPAAVKYVVDADTVGILMDWGGANYAFETVRFQGVLADEPGTPSGDAAAAWLTDLLPEGTHLLVRPQGLDRYGRIVAQVEAELDGLPTDIGERIVAEGHAWRMPE